jgi:hypothetical protein
MLKHAVYGAIVLGALAGPVFAQNTPNTSRADTELPTPAAPSDSNTNSAVPTVAVRMQAWDGSVWKRVTFGTTTALGSIRAAAVYIVDASGNQITAFGGSGGTASNYTSTFPSTGTAAGFSDGTNMQGARVFDVDTGAGTQYAIGVNPRYAASGGSVTASSGNGTTDSGTQRVTLSSDGTGVIGLAAGTQVIGALTANQSVNVAQIGGVSPATAMTFDMDTTGATVTREAVGIGVAASLGPVQVGGDASGLYVQGAAAHAATDAGQPLKQGFKGTTSVSGQTMVTNNQVTNGYAGIDGVQIVRPYANLEDRLNAVDTDTNASSTSLIAAQGAGIRFCITTVIVSNSSATNVTVSIQDGVGGTELLNMPASANMGGSVIPLPVPICTTANTALAVQPSASATTIKTTVVGFKTKL